LVLPFSVFRSEFCVLPRRRSLEAPDPDVLCRRLALAQRDLDRRTDELLEQRRIVPLAGFEIRERRQEVLAGSPLTLKTPSVAGRVMRMRREPGVQDVRSEEKTSM
jgi:hypothetical protein